MGLNLRRIETHDGIDQGSLSNQPENKIWRGFERNRFAQQNPLSKIPATMKLKRFADTDMLEPQIAKNLIGSQQRIVQEAMRKNPLNREANYKMAQSAGLTPNTRQRFPLAVDVSKRPSSRAFAANNVRTPAVTVNQSPRQVPGTYQRVNGRLGIASSSSMASGSRTAPQRQLNPAQARANTLKQKSLFSGRR